MPERTPEQIGREAGQAIADSIADGLETAILKLTDAIASLRVEQAELRDELLEIVGRLKAHDRQFYQQDQQLSSIELRLREL